MRKLISIPWKSFFGFLLLFVSSMLIGTIPVKAESNEKNLVNIYFFHSNSCSHCKSESKLLDLLEEQYSNIRIYCYEIHEDKNSEILGNVRKMYHLQLDVVPITIIGDTIYTGYHEEKSKLKFIKTVEYYSRYGYEDRVGEFLQIELLPSKKIEENLPTLEEFIDSYENYLLVGIFHTDDLDMSFNTFLLGILSESKLINILAIVVVVFFLSKINDKRHKIVLLAYYLVLSFLLFTTYLFSNKVYTLGIEILILILFMFGLLGFSRYKKKLYMVGNILVIIAIIVNYIENHFFGKYVLIFKNLTLLHHFSNLEVIFYYIQYLFIIFIVKFLFILIFQIGKRMFQRLFRYE